MPGLVLFQHCLPVLAILSNGGLLRRCTDAQQDFGALPLDYLSIEQWR